MIPSKWADHILSEDCRICFALVVVQFMLAGFQVITKVAVSNVSVTSLFVFAVYRNAIATVLLSPIAYFLEKKKRPALSFGKLCCFFISALIGISINQILFLLGIYYTSATFTSTMQNLIPAFTFIFAAFLRMEKIQLNGWDGGAKTLGTITSVCGAMVVSCYKGPSLLHLHVFNRSNIFPLQLHLGMDSKYKSLRVGSFCIVGNCATWAVWYLVQAPVLRNYPAYLSATAFTLGSATIQLLVVAAFLARHLTFWNIKSESYLIAVLYGGIMTSGLSTTMLSWCAHRGGPVLVGSYQPLQTVATFCLSTIFLGEKLDSGSVVGGLLIVIGLYLVLWGKSKEKKLSGRAAESINCNVTAGCSITRDERSILSEALIGSSVQID